MKIFNTLTRRKEEFVPITPGKVGIYVCGPTVYDYIHIGNARPMIVFDTLRRYLEYKGYEVNYVSNFTDVDDKIIKRAIQDNVDSTVISEKYIEECKKDMKALNVRPATTHPQATKEIPDMIDMVNTLINKKHAYEKNGTVYFRTRSFKDYGKLSHKNIDELESGHRDDAHQLKVSGEDEKEDNLDFVLWKPKKEGEPSWSSPWGNGRPGWHLECSVMSKKYIGGTIDIHAGGEDLIFPHHENEIAQSECCNGKNFATYWMHNAFLNIDNRKMSKSLGNFLLVRDISKLYDLQVLRFFMLSVHYRSPMNYSIELMESAKAGLTRIVTAVSRLKELEGVERRSNESEENVKAELDRLAGKFEAALDDDFNSADAISAIFEIVKLCNVSVNEESSKEIIAYAIDTITKLSDVLGLKVSAEKELLDDEIEALIAARTEARKNKDFARADAIRDELLEKGIILKDTRAGVTWERK